MNVDALECNEKEGENERETPKERERERERAVGRGTVEVTENHEINRQSSRSAVNGGSFISIDRWKKSQLELAGV